MELLHILTSIQCGVLDFNHSNSCVVHLIFVLICNYLMTLNFSYTHLLSVYFLRCFFLISFLPSLYELNNLFHHVYPTMVDCITTIKKSLGSSNHELKTLKLSQNKPFSCCLRHFVTVMESSMLTYSMLVLMKVWTLEV